jgi:hypothetical protein
MAIPAQQIGQSQKAKILWQISKQIDYLIKVMGNVQLLSNWTFIPNEVSVFPEDSTGYTLYEGSWSQYDDGQTNETFPLAGDFYTDGIIRNVAYLSTNGFMIFTNPNFYISGNQGDLYLTPGASLDDGDTQNFWYQNTGNANKWRTSMLVYCGHCCGSPSEQTPYSYILNIYRDSQFQYVEACAKSNLGSNGAGPEGFTETTSTATQVWQSDLIGTSWTYLGFGSIE